MLRILQRMVHTFSKSLLGKGNDLSGWKRKGYPPMPEELLDTPAKRILAAVCVSMWDLEGSYSELTKVLKEHAYLHSCLWLADIAEVGAC